MSEVVPAFFLLYEENIPLLTAKIEGSGFVVKSTFALLPFLFTHSGRLNVTITRHKALFSG